MARGRKVWAWAGVLALSLAGFWLLRPVAKPPTVEPTQPPVEKPAEPAPKPPPKTSPRPIPTVDSALSRTQALANSSFPSGIVARMELVTVRYRGFDGREHLGQIVVDKGLAVEVRDIFEEIFQTGFPIYSVIPVVRFGWDDRKSMAANNSSGFNYRKQITATGEAKILSKHAFGRAIDINPFQNPYVSRSGKATSTYNPQARGALTKESPVVKIFLRKGWKWGGNWSGNKDYQHFEKP